MDMVVGVDIHFEMVIIPPAPPVPTPFPNPFIGMVIDPAGLAIGLALGAALACATGGQPTGPVIINSMFATNVGTEAKGMGHILIPPGSMWVPMPKFPKPSFRGPPEFPGLPVKPEDDAVSIMGSTTVSVMGSSAVRMGEMWMSCGEPLRLPSSVVIAIPKGPLVLIGGPPGVNLMDALLGMIKTKWVAGYMHSLISRVKNTRLRNILNKAACFLTGHPVDVATGRMLTDNVDFELPGPLPLRFERDYASSWSHRDGPLGPGWSHSLDQAVWSERGKLVYLAGDGREIEFDVFDFPDHMLQVGQEVYDPINQLTLRFRSSNLIQIEQHNGETLDFALLPRASSSSQPAERRNWWRLQRRRARAGHEIALAYDDRGDLQSVRDSGGRLIGFEHDLNHRLIRVLLPHPTQDQAFIDYVRYAYDAEGDLVRVTDALGASWTFAYKRHLMVRETNRNGLSFYFAYDGFGSDAYCVRTWGDGGIYDHVIDYAKGTQTVVTNSLGFKTIYKLNPILQVVEVMDARGGSTKYEYDERSLKLVKQTDPVGGETKTEYDARGNPTRITLADGAEMLVEYDALNRPTRAVDAIGGEWRWSFDAAGRIVGTSNPANERAQFHWGEVGLIAFTDAAGQHTQLAYDSNGNLTSVTAPDGAVTGWTHDRLGRRVASTDANGNQRRYQRDTLGRAFLIDEPDGNQRQLDYDPQGNVVRARDRLYDVMFDYRGMNRLAARSQAGTRVEFLYDTEEQLVAIKNEHGLAYRFVLDAAGSVAEEHGFDDLRRRYERDAAGRTTLVKRPDNRETEYTYDELNRIVTVKHSDGSKEAYEYRSDGALTTAQNDALKVAFDRDPIGRIIKETQGDDWVSSTYDALGRRTELRSSKGLIQRVRRNAMGDVLALDAEVAGKRSATPNPTGKAERGASPANPTNSFSARFERDRLGLELERELPGGVRARWQRDQLGRPVRHEIWRGSHFHDAKQYVWDVNDRLTRVIDAMTGPVDYTHDALGNLAAASYADGKVDLRMPDAVGNLFRTGDRSDRKYGRAGELLESHDGRGITRYEYDAEGNLIRKTQPDGATWVYTWNGAGLLESVTRPDGHVVKFTYDAFARRLSKSYRGKTTRWIWDGNVPLHEWVERDTEAVDQDFTIHLEEDAVAAGEKALKALLSGRPANGPPRSEASATSLAHASAEGTSESPITWLFEPESFAPLAKLIDGKQFGIVTDHLGTPRAMFDGAGAEVWGTDVDAYGDLRNLRGARAACPFRWPGQYEDGETGLYYNRWRYYAPATGEYVSRDPLNDLAGLRLDSYAFWNSFHATRAYDLYGGSTSAYLYPGDPNGWVDPFGQVRIHTENGVEVNAYPGPPAGGIEHLPLHAHVEEAGQKETRVLMQDYYKKGKLVGTAGDVYPGDPPLSKKARKVIKANLPELSAKTDSVFHTGGC
jgi:RHS repeat-associated protein